MPGTGLLLAVGQRLAQQLGGTITVKSEVDRGTAFTVSLPVKS
jgi:signal transduction histidine kinase